MAGKSVPVVIVPRFTSYMGAMTSLSEPTPIAASAGIGLTLWCGPLHGSGGSLAMVVSIQESNDGETFVDCAGGPWVVPSAGNESFLTATFSMAWMRFVVLLNGTTPAVTCWASGAFELRER